MYKRQAGGWVNIKDSREELHNRIVKKNRRVGKRIREDDWRRRANKGKQIREIDKNNR